MALAAALALTLWAAPTASAGGPTSVLVVSPQSLEATALYYTDRRYRELETLLGPPDQGGPASPKGVDESNTRQINVTWMAHDISPHRFDRVFLIPGSQDIWVHTSVDLASWDGNWHTAADPERLTALLQDLGVLGKVSDDGGTGIFPAPPAFGLEAGAAQEPAAEPTPERAAAPGGAAAAAAGTSADSTDWWWALPGLAGGAIAALALRPLALRLPGAIESVRLRRSEKGPRQELRDL